MGKPREPYHGANSQQINYQYQAGHLMLSKKNLSEVAVSDYYTNLILKVSKKSQFKIDPYTKRNICKGCVGLLVPGLTAQVRILKKPAKVVEWKCLRCKTCKRFPCKKGYNPWFNNAFVYQNNQSQGKKEKMSSFVKIKEENLGMSAKVNKELSNSASSHDKQQIDERQ